MHAGLYFQIKKERDRFEFSGAEKRIILKQILKKVGSVRTGFI